MGGQCDREDGYTSQIRTTLNEVYQLMLANIYLLGEKIEEAKWILENYNYNRFAIGKDPLTNCYYLYLTAKIRGDVNYEERVLDEVGKTYMRHQDSWWLLYMILNLDTRYKNPYKRLEVLEQQFEYGIHSVMFYLEAYLCYQEKPTLLKKLGTFEIQVLNFATKIPDDDKRTGPLYFKFCQPAEKIQ